jgi:hypothetical protein
MTELYSPLSFCQELLLYQELFSGFPPTVSRIATIQGPLDLAAFKRGADMTLRQHEPLRSTWTWSSGEPVASLLPFDPEAPSVTMLEREADGLAAASAGPIGMTASKPPHMRHWLVPTGPDEHLWVFGVHHMASDAVSLKLYGETFRQAYAALPISDAPTTSAIYARAQRDWLRTPAAQADFEWWQRRLESIPAQAIPAAAASNPDFVAVERQELRIRIDADSVIGAARVARVPVAALFLAAYAGTAAVRTGSPFTHVFTNLPGRSLRGAGSATGAFYNSVPVKLSGDDDLDTAVVETADALLEALDHQEVPVALLSLGAVERGGIPLAERFPVSFNVVDHPLGSFRLPGCRLLESDGTGLGRPRWGLTGPTPLGNGAPSVRAAMDWLVSVLPTSILVTLEYTPNFIDRADVEKLLSDYEGALCALFAEGPNSASKEAGLIADWSVEP